MVWENWIDAMCVMVRMLVSDVITCRSVATLSIRTMSVVELAGVMASEILPSCMTSVVCVVVLMRA